MTASEEVKEWQVGNSDGVCCSDFSRIGHDDCTGTSDCSGCNFRANDSQIVGPKLASAELAHLVAGEVETSGDSKERASQSKESRKNVRTIDYVAKSEADGNCSSSSNKLPIKQWHVHEKAGQTNCNKISPTAVLTNEHHNEQETYCDQREEPLTSAHLDDLSRNNCQEVEPLPRSGGLLISGTSVSSGADSSSGGGNNNSNNCNRDNWSGACLNNWGPREVIADIQVGSTLPSGQLDAGQVDHVGECALRDNSRTHLQLAAGLQIVGETFKTQEANGQTSGLVSRTGSEARRSIGSLPTRSASNQATRRERRVRRSLDMLGYWTNSREIMQTLEGHRSSNLAADHQEGPPAGHRIAHQHAEDSWWPEQAPRGHQEPQNVAHQINIESLIEPNHMAAQQASHQPIVTSSQFISIGFAPDNHHTPTISTDQSQPPVLMGHRRLWHSLVLPFLLACIIFLAVLWTRQLSLALTNDTVFMMMILMAVFMVMSGVAFWLSCDRHFQGLEQQQNLAQDMLGSAEAGSSEGQAVGGSGVANGARRSLCSCQLRGPMGRQAHTHCQMGRRQSPNDRPKCNCSISVIDCQPPDYYAALKESIPISSLYASPTQVHLDAEPSDPVLRELYLLPPSYEEFTQSCQRKEYRANK